MKSTTRFFAALVAGLAVAVPAYAQKAALKTETSLPKEEVDNVLDRMSIVVKKYAFVPGIDFTKWDKFVEDSRNELVKSKDQNDLVIKLNGLLQKFGASHIVLNTPKGAQEMRQGKVVGIGFQPELVKDGIRVNDVFPDSPAAENGFEPGDIIIEANGKKPDNVFALRGEEGTDVTIKLKKASNGEVKTLMIKRRAFSFTQPETITWLNTETALVKIPSFMYYKQANVDTIMRELSDKQAKTLVLDLRNNGGGYVWALQNLAGYLIPEDKPLGTFINKQSWEKFTAGKKIDTKKINLTEVAAAEPKKLNPISKATLFTGKVIVLVNGNTGSASEMMAAALRENLGAKVIGAKSAGAVLASTMAPLPGGYMLQYPFEDYVTIKGLRLEGNGVKPDYEAGTPKSRFDEDPGVKIALKLAKGEKP